MDELFPNSEHRFCVRHSHTNFRKHFKGKALTNQLWSCASATYQTTFDRAMNILQGPYQGAHDYMKK